MNRFFTAKRMVQIALLAAMATLIMTFKFPLPFAPSFYKLEFSEIPVLLGSFALGPVSGVMIEAIKVLLNFVIDGTTTGGIGELANFLMGCALIVPAALLYRRRRTLKAAAIGCAVGVLSMVAVASLLNVFVLLPVYAKVFGMPLSTIIGMGTKINASITGLFSFALYILVPFNLLKGGACAALACVVYPRIRGLLETRTD